MEELNAALHRSLIGDALARLSPSHRAVLRRSYYLGWTLGVTMKPSGFAVLWPCQQLLNRVVDNQTPLRE